VVAIEDCIEGGGVHAIESHLHIHPSLTVEPADSGVRISAKGRLIMFVSPTGQGTVETGAGWHCAEFNRKVSCTVLRLKSNSAALPVGFDWEFRLCQGC
jgi:hypothetical protein